MIENTIEMTVSKACSSQNQYWWRLSRDLGRGYIRRSRLEDGFFMTHSFLHSSRPLRSHFDEGGPWAAFVFMIGGLTRVRSGAAGSWVEMRRGENYAFISRGDAIQRETPACQDMEALVVKIDLDYMSTLCDDLEAVAPDALKRPGAMLARPGSPSIRSTLERIRRNRCQTRTERLLAHAHAIELIRSQFLDERGLSYRRETDRIRELGAFITENAVHEHRLQELAQMAAMNRTKLNRLFKEVHGCTVFEYIRRAKLRQAEYWLRHSNMDITAIAHAAGFCSSSHFSRCFRSAHGVPPKCFRSQG